MADTVKKSGIQIQDLSQLIKVDKTQQKAIIGGSSPIVDVIESTVDMLKKVVGIIV
jgi:hypothetical protein